MQIKNLNVKKLKLNSIINILNFIKKMTKHSFKNFIKVALCCLFIWLITIACNSKDKTTELVKPNDIELTQEDSVFNNSAKSIIFDEQLTTIGRQAALEKVKILENYINTTYDNKSASELYAQTRESIISNAGWMIGLPLCIFAISLFLIIIFPFIINVNIGWQAWHTTSYILISLISIISLYFLMSNLPDSIDMLRNVDKYAIDEIIWSVPTN